MTLYDLLNTSVYTQQFSVYLTNAYDQNLLIGRGTRAEMLDENETGGGIFANLMSKVDRWEIRKERMIVFIVDENYNERVEKQFSNSDKWGKEPENRPWRHSIETELYTDKYIKMIFV